jgi:hypothetical protein
MMRKALWLLPLAGMCLSLPAYAQVNPFRGSKAPPLNSADITALTDATNRLLDRPQLVAGGKETWSNPQSGANGTVTAGNPLQRHGLGCRSVQYLLIFPSDNSQRNRTLVWCKTKDGWKIG